MTTRPRFGPIVTLTRVSRYWENSSSSSSSPGARSLRTVAARRPGTVSPDPDGASPAELGALADGLLDLADRQPVGHRPAGELLLVGPVGGAEQGAGVAGGQVAVGHHLLDGGRQLEQAQRVAHRRSALADPRRDLVVGEVEVLDQLLVGGRLLERVEVLAMDVLDQGVLERGGVVDVADDGGHRREAGPLGRPPAALAGDELVAVVAEGSDEDRLQDAELPHRRGQRGERLLVEGPPGLVGVGRDAADRDLGQAQRAGLAGRHLRRDERPETSTETATARHR